MDRTLAGIASFLEDSLAADRPVEARGLLQTLDPRIKLATFLMLLVATSLLRHLTTLLGIFLLTLALGQLSRIRLAPFLKRAWLSTALFTGLIVVPAIFNIFTPGDPLIILLRLDRGLKLGPWAIPDEVSITVPGIMGAALLIFRVAISVSLVILLTQTTRWTAILKGLRALHLPSTFVLVLGITYRYIFLLLRLSQEMCLARKSRTIRPGLTGEGQRWVASRLGLLLKRSYQLSGEVHSAMVARGFMGEAKALEEQRIGVRDLAWALSLVALSGALLWLDTHLGT